MTSKSALSNHFLLDKLEVFHMVVYLTRVTVCEQRADGQQHFGDGERWAPIVLQDVQTDNTLTVDVAVVDSCAKRHLGDQNRTTADVNKSKTLCPIINGEKPVQDLMKTIHFERSEIQATVMVRHGFEERSSP